MMVIVDSVSSRFVQGGGMPLIRTLFSLVVAAVHGEGMHPPIAGGFLGPIVNFSTANPPPPPARN